ncbi:MAG: hypothetical protein J6T10_22610 [Methanobrevibacter sp.]|nr:hypothetical protein [Methanobrevibacter sp.]
MPNVNYIGSTDVLYILTKLKQVLDGTNGFVPGYVQKVSGKGLSTNDLTNALLQKLNGIADGADAVSFTQTQTSGIKVGSITINDTTIDIYAPNQAITVDSSMSSTSENPVQNKVIKSYVDSAVASVVQIRFDGDTTGVGYTSLSDLQTKHPTGENGVIYLVQNSGSAPNVKDEYFWNTTSSSYERFGSTDVDLSGYLQRSELVEVTTTDIDTMFTSVFG